MAPQHELVRIVRTSDGLIVSRVAPGRGAWLCAGSASCLVQAERRKAFPRALRAPVEADEIRRLGDALGW